MSERVSNERLANARGAIRRRDEGWYDERYIVFDDLVADLLDARRSLSAQAEALTALELAARGIESALDAIENDRLAGRYLRHTKRQSVDARSMHGELATAAMEAEGEARSALTATRATIERLRTLTAGQEADQK